MKNSIIKLASMALLLGLTACQEKLDTVSDGNNLSAVYMYANTASVNFAKASKGGNTKVDIRLSNLQSRDVAVTIAVTDFFPEFNKKNNTNYKVLPISEYKLYEIDNPQNSSTNGTLNLTIKAGKAVAQIGVEV